MNNSAMLQMMSTQNLILNELRDLKAKEALKKIDTSLSSQAMIQPDSPKMMNGQQESMYTELPPLNINPAPMPFSTELPKSSFQAGDTQLDDVSKQLDRIYQVLVDTSNKKEPFQSKNAAMTASSGRTTTASNPIAMTSPPKTFYDTNLDTSFQPLPVIQADMDALDSININPTDYAQIAKNAEAPIELFNPTNPLEAAAYAEEQLDDVFRYDGSRMSRMAQEEYMMKNANKLQLGTVNAAADAGILVGGGAGTLMSGLLPSVAVGAVVAGVAAYAGNQMVDGAKETLDYQEILRASGYKAMNAFETTNEFGGLGFSLDDRQEISGFVRELAIEEFLAPEEMSNILQGSLDNKLLKSATSVQSFKEKFKKLVQGVKEITVMMDQTIDESLEFMGQMERLGIGSDQYTQVSSLTKVAASMVGMDANTYSQLMMDQTTQIVAGTGMDTVNVVEGISANTFALEAISDVSERQDGQLKQYIKNNGGVSALSGEIASVIHQNVQAPSTLQTNLMMLAAPAIRENEFGNLEVDHFQLNDIIHSEKSNQQLMDDAANYARLLSPADQARLKDGFGAALSNEATQMEIYGLINRAISSLTESTGMDEVTAIQYLGLAKDQTMAELMNQTLLIGADEKVQQQLDAKSYKEMTDAANIADSPGIKKEIEFWFKRNLGSWLSAPGIYMSDEIGDVAQDLQMRLRGIRDAGIVGGDLEFDFDENYMDNVFYNKDSLVNKNVELVQGFESYEPFKLTPLELKTGYHFYDDLKKVEPNEQTVLETLSSERFSYLIDAAKAGELSAAQIQEFSEKTTAEDVHKSTQQQYQYVLDTLQGEYLGDGWLDTAFKKGEQFFDFSRSKLHWGFLRDTGEDDLPNRKSYNSLEAIQKEEDWLTKDTQKLEAALNKAIIKSNVTGETANDIQQAIRAGDMERLRELTSNKKFLDLGEDYAAHREKILSLNTAKDGFFEIQDYTLTLAQSTGASLGYLKASGIFTEDEFYGYFGDISNKVTDITDNLSGMSDEKLAEASEELLQSGDVYSLLSQKKQEQIAVEIAKKFNEPTIDFLYEDGTETISGQKMHKYLLGIGKESHSSENEAKNIANGGIENAIDDHKKALNSVLDAFIQETENMYSAIGVMRSPTQRNYTSVTTNQW